MLDNQYQRIERRLKSKTSLRSGGPLKTLQLYQAIKSMQTLLGSLDTRLTDVHFREKGFQDAGQGLFRSVLRVGRNWSVPGSGIQCDEGSGGQMEE